MISGIWKALLTMPDPAAQATTRKPRPTCMMPRPNFMVGSGSIFFEASQAHSAAKIGAKIRMKPALKDWTWAAVMVASIQKPVGVMPAAASWAGVPMVMPRNCMAIGVMVRSTFRSANRFSEVPACSNRVKKTTAPKISTTASIIR